MRYALIDNSTLTAVQRLMGEIPVRNSAVIDNDIVAFENYIQAILFYDELVCIDDYKDRYKAKRISYFLNIRFISTDIFDYQSFVDKANEITKDISLQINGGKISDADYKDYFERLQMTFKFTWDLSASKYFLTQKMLIQDTFVDRNTFNSIHSQLFHENNEANEVRSKLIKKNPTLYDSKGNKIEMAAETGTLSDKTTGFSNQFDSLLASLSWMSQRTAFYVLCADHLYCDLFLQPIRQEFLQNIIRRIYPQYKLGVFSDFRNSINNQSEETIKKVLKESENYSVSVDIPLFTAYFAAMTNNSKSIVEAAYNERDNKHFVEARNQLRELNVILDSGNRAQFIRQINLLASSLNKTFKQIESKYGLGDKQGFATSQLKFLYSYIPLLKEVELPKALDFQIPQLEFLKHLKPKKGLNAVYRNIIEDHFTFDALGKYKDILIGNIDKSRSYQERIKFGDDYFMQEHAWRTKNM